MRYVYSSIILFLILSVFGAFIYKDINTDVEVGYDIKYSNTVCMGDTCVEHLLKHMGDKEIIIIKKDLPEMCNNANWSFCQDRYIIKYN